MLHKRLAAAAILSLLIFSSCRGIKITELNERLIIEAIGIDYSDGEYTVTVQALDSASPADSTKDGENGELTKTFVFGGKTVGEALDGISLQTGKVPLYSQARILLIGIDTAKENIGASLDFFLREYTTRTDILFAVCEKTAKDTLGAPFGKNTIGAAVIETAVRSGANNGNVVGVPLYKFINLLLDDKSGAFCPVIGVRREEMSEDCRIEIIGTALFSDNRLTKTVGRYETRGLLYLINRISSADLAVEAAGGRFTVRAVDSKTKIKPPVKGGSVFSVSIKTECDITEFESEDFTKLTTDAVETVRLRCEAQIKNQAELALSAAYGEAQCDICRFNRRLWLSDPKRYRESAGNNGIFDGNFTADITVEVKIRRTGKETLYEN